jgi:arsenical pump membrane protein
VAVLVAVLALVAWGRVTDFMVAGAGAVVVVAAGLVGLDEVGDVVDRLAPTLAFLAAVFVLAEISRLAGLFAAAGTWMAEHGHTSRELLLAVCAAAVVVTVVMSLDATAVLFTPVVIQLVAQRDVASEPPLLATAQLANASSSLLPVSNLTNLIVFSATGLTFGGFALRMALPTLAASSVVTATAVLGERRLAPAGRGRPPTRADPFPCGVTAAADAPGATGTSCSSDSARTPETRRRLDGFARFVLGAVAALTVAFFVGSALGVAPAWLALAGAGVVAVVAVGVRRTTPRAVLRAASPSFLVFVAGLGIVVQAAVDHGLGDQARELLPTGAGFLALVGTAVVAAVLANLVNNVPATLLLVSVVPSGAMGPLLAVLLGVNIGPNLTYTGSLATLLWRRAVRRADVEPSGRSFFRFALVATPAALLLATASLWVILQVSG